MSPRSVALSAVAVAALALARLATGPSFQQYNPLGAGLVDGLPVTWEMVYYLVHLPTFLGDGVPTHTIGSVHYRALSGLHAASMLTVWLGSRFWAFALVDAIFWLLAGLATHHLTLRLRLGRTAASLAALLCLASPLFAATMWTHVLHIAEFASLPIGLWAATVLVDEVRSRGRLALSLGALLVVLSLSYQYQWIVLPLLVVLLASAGRFDLRDTLAITAGALGCYVVATALIRVLLILGRLDPLTNPLAEHMQAVAEPAGLVAARWNEFRASGDPRALLPRLDQIVSTVRAYHPLVFAFGVAGVLLSGWTVRWMTLVASAVSLASFMLYPAPWTAMSAYPLLYVGAGVACRAVGDAVYRLLRAASPSTGARRMEKASYLVAAGCGAVLVATTNLDLVGDHTFLLQWWHMYYPRPLF